MTRKERLKVFVCWRLRARAFTHATLAAFASVSLAGCSTLTVLEPSPSNGLVLVATHSPYQPTSRDVQERIFAVPKATAFSSVLAILADDGFRPTQANSADGFVTAVGSGSERISLHVDGLRRTIDQTMATVFITEEGSGTIRVRAVFSHLRAGRAALEASERVSVEQPIYDAFFGRLEQEMILRDPIRGMTENDRHSDDGPVMNSTGVSSVLDVFEAKSVSQDPSSSIH